MTQTADSSDATTSPTPHDDGSAETSDAGIDSDGDASPNGACTSTDTSCLQGLPFGWSPVVRPTAEGTECPSGYTTFDGMNPEVTSDVCACLPSPSNVDPPSCDKSDDYGGQYSLLIAACAENTGRFKVNGSACSPVDNAAGWISGKFSPIKRLGACDAHCEGDASKLKKTRICEPAPACEEEACLGIGSDAGIGDFESCIAKDGDVECPSVDGGAGLDGGGTTDAGAGYRKFVLGSDPTIACKDAKCDNDISCKDAVLHLFNDATCSKPEYGSVKVDGQCNGFIKGLVAVKYTANMTVLPSKLSTPPKVGVSFGSTKTICCANRPAQ